MVHIVLEMYIALFIFCFSTYYSVHFTYVSYVCVSTDVLYHVTVYILQNFSCTYVMYLCLQVSLVAVGGSWDLESIHILLIPNVCRLSMEFNCDV